MSPGQSDLYSTQWHTLLEIHFKAILVHSFNLIQTGQGRGNEGPAELSG